MVGNLVLPKLRDSKTRSAAWNVVQGGLNHLRRQTHNLDEAALAQLAGHRSEDTRAARVFFIVDQHQGVAIEADVAAVLSPRRLLAADDDTFDHVARLDVAAGHGLLNARHDDVAETGIAAPGPAQHLDAHALLGTRIVCHIQVRIHLNHVRPSFPTTDPTNLPL